MSQPGVKKEAPPIEEELYKKREKIYAREVHGMFAGLRLLTVGVLLGLYYGIPWVNLERPSGRPVRSAGT